jgi:hypothetical protein
MAADRRASNRGGLRLPSGSMASPLIASLANLPLGFRLSRVVAGRAGRAWGRRLSRYHTLLLPTDLASFLELIRQNGDAAYSFMFAYAASHSLLFALFGGYAAHSGALSFVPLIVICWFGSFMLHRYPHGIRGVAGFAYGMSPLPWSTFLVLNFVAAGLWSCAVVSAGYAFGQVSEKVMSDASSSLGLIMLIAFLGLSWVLSKKLERVLERG